MTRDPRTIPDAVSVVVSTVNSIFVAPKPRIGNIIHCVFPASRSIVPSFVLKP